MYRVWGGTVGMFGGWLTPFRPRSAAEARSTLSLPPENTAEFISEVRVPQGTRIQFGQAEPLWGQPGGGWQVELRDPIHPLNFGPGVSLK